LEGITYYKSLVPTITEKYTLAMKDELLEIEGSLINIIVPSTAN
jgi:hypothetical protein